MDAMIAAGGASALSAKDLIILAQNPEKLAEVNAALDARYEVLKAQGAELDRKIALAGTAEEIPALHAEAKRVHGEAEAALAAANKIRGVADAEAAVIVARAREAAKATIADAQSEATALKAQAEADSEAAAGQLAKAAQTTADLDARKAALKQREDDAAAAIARADAAEAAFRIKTEKLKALMA